MHLAEYERYVALIPAKSQAHQSSQVEHDTQQSVVSTIKSKYFAVNLANFVYYRNNFGPFQVKI